MMRSVLNVAVIALAAYALVCVAVYLLQAKLIYFPGPPPTSTPAALGLEYEPVRLTTSDGVELSAWYLPAREAKGAVLYCHGNAGTIADRLEGARAFIDGGFSVLLLDYRGYGASRGKPSEEGTYLDAEAAHDWLTAKRGIDAKHVVVYGESLGAGVAIELALRRPCAAAIVESAFTSIVDIGRSAYPFLPVRLLTRIRYSNIDKVSRLQVPLLVIHSPHDDIVPFAHGQALFAAARDPKQFLTTEGAHNEGGSIRRAEWRAELRTFVERAIAR